ncbi:hypothetical protein B0H66DRAFT_547194, partial [Apodospora peruviana]
QKDARIPKVSAFGILMGYIPLTVAINSINAQSHRPSQHPAILWMTPRSLSSSLRFSGIAMKNDFLYSSTAVSTLCIS